MQCVMNKIGALLFGLLGLFSTFLALANPPEQVKSPVVFKSLAEATLGLHPKEVSDLQEEIFDKHKIIDLERSGLAELSAWLTKLTERYTLAVETFGDYFPEYRINVLATMKTEAFVYKFKIPGQRFYRGHVFISAGMIKRMIEPLASDVSALSNAQVQDLMSGIRGVLAHEFVHPKQDEVVKWSWREGNDRSMQSHGQADEMATDVMALKLLKEAKLPPSDMLTGLELVFGEKPTTGNYVGRTIEAGLSSHPEEKLRLNIVRGGLVHLRREEGKSPIEVIEFDAGRMRGDLTQIVQKSDLKTTVESIEEEALKNNRSAVMDFIDAMLTDFKKNGEGLAVFDSSTKVVYLDWLPELNRVLKKYPSPTTNESLAVRELFRQIKEYGKERFSNNLWTVEGSGGSGSDPYHYSQEVITKGQRLYEEHELFKNKDVQQWINENLAERFWDFTVGENSGGFHFLPTILPRAKVEDIYRKALTMLHEQPAELRSLYLLQIMLGMRTMGGSIDVDFAAFDYLKQNIVKDPVAYRSFLKRMHEIFPDEGRRKRMKPLFITRIMEAGPRAQELINGWAELFESILRSPELINSSGDLKEAFFGRYRGESYTWAFMQWALEPSSFPEFKNANVRLNSERLANRVVEIFSTKQWQSLIGKTLESSTAAAGAQFKEARGFSEELVTLVSGDKMPFTPKQQERIMDAIMAPTKDAQPGSRLFEGRVRFEVDVIREIGVRGKARRSKRIVELAKYVKTKSGMDLLPYLEKTFGSSEDVVRKLFDGGNHTIFLLGALRDKGAIDAAAYEAAMDKYLFKFRPTQEHVNIPLAGLDAEAAFKLWRTYSPNRSPQEVIALLNRVIEAFKVMGVEVRVEHGWGRGADDASTRLLKQAGLQVDPRYARFIELIHQGLADDFRRLLGMPRDFKVTDASYATAFMANFEALKSFYKLIFNPDGAKIPVEFRELLKFFYLDQPAETFAALIPAAALSAEQRFAMWEIMAAKRANRHVDAFFEKHVYGSLKTLPEETRLAEYDRILSFGMLRSERLKNELMSEVLMKRIEPLRSRAGALKDGEIHPFIQKIVSRIPGSSRFRDDVLEKLAWRLELTEPQLHKFIEPLKSFNFKTINPLTLNLLSTLSVLQEKLSVREKLSLVDYFQSGQGSLKSALPWLDKFVEVVNHELERQGINNFDWLDHLESFVRDAGEGDKLVMIELIVGSKGAGLWSQGEKVRNELYAMAELEAGSLKRKLFEMYLEALPKYEHSVTMSYLLATKGESNGSELLKIMEMFDAPGIKFAQMSSVLGIFGQEKSDELAKAKDRAMPPTRAQIFELLQKHYSEEQFASIKRVRKLFGSGSLKYVVLVEYKDGHREAVSIRRPYLDERIEGVLEIVSKWADHMRGDPELAQKYDFDYYLKSLREQLAQEVQFKREAGLSKEMEATYAKLKSHRGWKFQVVPQSKVRTQGDFVMHFMAVENAVPFKSLTEVDRKTVSELIVAGELRMMFDFGHFDADRHMGNYLFDPKTKTIHVIDMGQTYNLRPNKITKPGDPFVIAKMLYGVTHADAKVGAQALAEAFLSVAEEPVKPSDALEHALVGDIEKALSTKEPIKVKMFAVLAELNKHRVRIPLRYSMGVIKGLMIVLNEEYAKEVAPEFIQERVEKFIRKQFTLGLRFKAFEYLDRCARLLTNREIR